MAQSLICNAADEDPVWEMAAAIVQSVGIFITVLAGMVGYIWNEANTRRAQAVEAEKELEAKRERDELAAKHREHENERDIAKHLREAEGQRLVHQMHDLITPMVNNVHAYIHCINFFMIEIVEDFADELLSVGALTMPPLPTGEVTTDRSAAATDLSNYIPGSTLGASRSNGTVDIAHNEFIFTASTYAADRSYGFTSVFPRTPLADGHDRHTWDAPLVPANMVIIPPGEGENGIFLTHLPSFFADWVRACFRSDNCIARRVLPPVVYEAVRLAGASSPLALAYRSWARDVLVPHLRRCGDVWREYGSFVQPLPWGQVDKCFSRFCEVAQRSSMKGKPRCFIYILLDVHVQGWERLLKRWDTGHGLERLYPTEMFPFGILFYTIRMQDMVAKRQEAVSGHSYLSETKIEEALAEAAKVETGEELEKFLAKQPPAVLKAIGRSSMVHGDAAFFRGRGVEAISEVAGRVLRERSMRERGQKVGITVGAS